MVRPIGIDPGDGGNGQYPVQPAPTPTPSPTPTPTPTPGPTPTPTPAPVIPSTVVQVVAPTLVSTVPLSALPAQTVRIALGDQPCRIDVYQKSTGLYLDLYVADRLIVAGSLCLNATPLVRAAYTGFIGELAFFDTQGTSDPTYDGLGGRYPLVWVRST